MLKKKVSHTCIAVIKNRRGKLLMAGDRKASYGWSEAEFMERPKIRKRSGILLGASGDGPLCTLLVDIMPIPQVVTDPETYMFHVFKPQLAKTLKQQGYTDAHKGLRIPAETVCSALVGVTGQVFRVDIHNPDPENIAQTYGEIAIDFCSTPVAVGCGSTIAVTSLIKDLRKAGCSTKEHLIEAVELACELSPGCGLPPGIKPDVIIED